MIPRRIYYGWFGKNPLTPLAVKCLESWRIFCPDYEIVELNETNIDLDSCKFVKDSYSCRKFAFVWDYARMFAMYNFGGVTLDSDVEVVKPLDSFLGHNAFTGIEYPRSIGTAVMGTEKGHWFGKEMVEYYKTAIFKPKRMKTNIKIMTGLFKHNLRDLVVYEKEYFCPLDYNTIDENSRSKITEKTHAVHWFAGSWMNK